MDWRNNPRYCTRCNVRIGVLMFTLFKKPKAEPVMKKIVTCSKHGVVPNFTISIIGRKDYDVCWDCIGEFGSQYCTVVEEEINEE